MKKQILFNLSLLISFMVAAPLSAQLKVIDVTNDKRFHLNIDDSSTTLGPTGNTYGIAPVYCEQDPFFGDFACFSAIIDDGSGFPEFDGVPSQIGLDLSEIIEPGSGQPVIADESLVHVDPDTIELRVSVESTNGASLFPAGFVDSNNQPLENYGLFVGASGGGNAIPLPEPTVFVTDARIEMRDADANVVFTIDTLALNSGDEPGWDGTLGVIFFGGQLDAITKLELIVEFDGMLDIVCGDVNLDGSVTLTDVQPFVELLTEGDYQIEADINLDGAVDLLDIQGFVDKLTG